MATVDIGTESYQSFVSVDQADVILAADVMRAAGWATRNEDAKGRGLASATRMLLTLPWAVEPPPTPAASPQIVKDVTAMLAEDLLANPQLFADATGNSNVKVAKAGSASVEFFKPVEGGPPIPRALWDMLAAAGLVGGETGQLDDGPFVSGALGCVRPLGGRYGWDWPIAEQDHD